MSLKFILFRWQVAKGKLLKLKQKKLHYATQLTCMISTYCMLVFVYSTATVSNKEVV